MHKIAVIGDKNSVLAFKALGLDVFTVTDDLEARKTVNRLAKNQYGVIFITEQIANKILDTISSYDDLLLLQLFSYQITKEQKISE